MSGKYRLHEELSAALTIIWSILYHIIVFCHKSYTCKLYDFPKIVPELKQSSFVIFIKNFWRYC